MLKRIIKSSLLILGLLISLYLATITIIKAIIDPNDYIDAVKSSLSSNNVRLTSPIEIRWMSFPSLGLISNDISIASDSQVKGNIDEISVTLDLTSLLTIPSEGLVGLKVNVDAKDGEMSFNSSGVDLPIKVSELNISLSGVSSELEHLDINFTGEILNQFDVKGSANFGKQVSFDDELIVNLSDLNLNIDLIDIEGSLNINLNKIKIDGKLAIIDLKASELIAKLKSYFPLLKLPTFKNKSALSNLSLKSNFSIEPQGFSKYFHILRVDDQMIEIESETDLKLGTMKTYIQADSINLDKYSTQNTGDNSYEFLLSSMAIPSYIWKQKSVTEINVNKLISGDILSENNLLLLENTRDVVKVVSLNTSIMGGDINGVGAFNLNSELDFNFRTQTKLIPVKQILRVLNIPGDLNGFLNSTISLSGSAYNANSSNGSGSFKIENFSVPGKNIENEICEFLQPISGSNYSSSVESHTLFDELTGNLSITDGNVRFDNIQTRFGNIDVKSNGNLDLNKDEYKFNFNILNKTTRTSENGCAFPKSFSDLTLPISCAGILNQTFLVQQNCKIDSSIMQNLLKKNVIKSMTPRLNSNLETLKNIFK